MCIRDSNKGIKPLLKKGEFEFTMNKAFKDVINHCKEIKRPGQEGTWITNEVERAYCRLHDLGYAPVSYTHLRAHETVLDLVCRLLLEKKTI